jgi:hypothetical protein
MSELFQVLQKRYGDVSIVDAPLVCFSLAKPDRWQSKANKEIEIYVITTGCYCSYSSAIFKLRTFQIIPDYLEVYRRRISSWEIVYACEKRMLPHELYYSIEFPHIFIFAWKAYYYAQTQFSHWYLLKIVHLLWMNEATGGHSILFWCWGDC